MLIRIQEFLDASRMFLNKSETSRNRFRLSSFSGETSLNTNFSSIFFKNEAKMTMKIYS